ncbi:unnamed protein product, partial [Ectocarpus sp. 12 AP-2014]
MFSVGSESGHATRLIGWSNSSPKWSFCSEFGHETSSKDWLKHIPKHSFRSELGHDTSTIDWLKSPPKSRLGAFAHENSSRDLVEYGSKDDLLKRIRPHYSINRLVEAPPELKRLQRCWPFYEVDRLVEWRRIPKLNRCQPWRPRHSLKAASKVIAELHVFHVRHNNDRVSQFCCCRDVPHHGAHSQSWHACPTLPLRVREWGIHPGQQPARGLFVESQVYRLIVSARHAEIQGRKLQLLGGRVPALLVARLVQCNDEGAEARVTSGP